MRQIALNGKKEFDFRAQQVKNLAPKIWDDIYGANPTQQVQLASYYAAKQVGAVSVYNDLFSQSDVVTTLSTSYLTNLNGGKLEAGKLFLLTHIQLLWGNAANINETVFGRLPESMLNGIFGIKQSDRVIVNKYTSMRMFDTAELAIQTANTNAAAGTAIAATNQFVGAGLVEVTPKFLVPQQLIEVEMKFAKALSSNDNVMIHFFGVQNENL